MSVLIISSLDVKRKDLVVIKSTDAQIINF
jgi:hypothetical protein